MKISLDKICSRVDHRSENTDIATDTMKMSHKKKRRKVGEPK